MPYAAEQAKLNSENGKGNASDVAINNILTPLAATKDLTGGFTFVSRSYQANGILKINKKLLFNNGEVKQTVNEMPEAILLAYAAEVQAVLDYENGTNPNFPG